MEPEERVSHYRLGRRIGAGGMGVVYDATDERLGRRVALKFLPPEWSSDGDARTRFHREARAAAALDHQNICTVYEVDETRHGRVFLVTALYDGQTLKERLKSGPVSVEDAIDWCAQVADGLSAAHKCGVSHRDVKPSNLILTDAGVVKILDFGLALFNDQTRLTGSGATPGTIAYMAPEALRESETIDERVDVWALGVVLYELVTGARPFTGRRPESVMYSILHEEPARVASAMPTVDGRLNKILERALAKSPSARYRDCRAFASALRSLQRSLTTEASSSRGDVRIGRRLLPISVTIAALLVASTLAIGSRGHWIATDRPPSTRADLHSETPSVAVMRFTNLAGDPDLDWLGSGLAEMIVTDLAESGDVDVAGTDRVYRAIASLDLPRQAAVSDSLADVAAREVGSRIIVLGSFVRAGESYRITVHLRDVERRTRIASASEDADGLEEVFGAVDGLTTSIRRALGVGLSDPGLRDELRSVTTSSPEAFRRYTAGLQLRYDGRTEEAIEEFRRAVELDGSFALALSKLSVLHALAGHDREAKELSERAMEHIDRLPSRERYYVEGNHYSWYEETYGRAIEAYRRTIEDYPNHWPALHNLASTYADLELYAHALPLLERVSAGVPNRISNYWVIAVCHFALGHTEDGARLLERIARERPLSRQAALQLADYRTMMGDADGARRAFAAAGIEGDGFESLDRRWILHVLEAESAALVTWKVGARQQDETYDRARGLFRRGLLALHTGEYETGIELLQKAADRMPEPGRTSAFPRRLAAHALLELGAYQRALAEADKAMRDGRGDQGEWGGLYVKGVALARSGDSGAARDVARQLRDRTALIPGPKEERRYLHLLGEIARVTGDLDAALARLSSAEKLLSAQGILWDRPAAPEHVPLWYSLARVHVERGEAQEAVRYFQRIANAYAERLYWPIEYHRSLRFLENRSLPQDSPLPYDSVAPFSGAR